TVTALAKDGGGIAANVNRWRAQVGLAALKDEDALKAVRPATGNGIAGHALDVSGPGADGKPAPRGLGTFVKRRRRTRVFRMAGQSTQVSKHKADFEAFLKSVRFDDPKKK